MAPPLLSRFWSRLRRCRRETWTGIYPHLRNSPRSGPGFEAPDTIESSLERLRRLSTPAAGHGPPDAGPAALLSVLAAAVGSFRAGGVTVLDFGGSVGADYVLLRSAMGTAFPLRYHVVENPPVCRAGAAAHAADPAIHFHSAIPGDLAPPDIVVVNSALQYVEDYQSVLSQLCRLNPKFVLFLRLDAGPIPTHARTQVSMPGSRVPCWFFNLEEIVDLMARGGYSLLFHGSGGDARSQHNLPPRYRLEQTCNLLFRRGPAGP